MNTAIGMLVFGLTTGIAGLTCIWRFYFVYKKQKEEERWRDLGLGIVLFGASFLVLGGMMFSKYGS